MKLFKFLAVFLAIVPIRAQTPDVDVVLDKAGDYVATYERTFVGVVAEETYRQEVRGAAGADPRGFPAEARSQRRDLKSDMLSSARRQATAGSSSATCSRWTASRCATCRARCARSTR